jgi:peptidoglycan hydrolase-like amidase
METHTLTGNNKFITNLKFSSQTEYTKNIKDTYNNTNLINGVFIRQAGEGVVCVGTFG